MKNNIGIISCCSKKLKGKHKAKDIYISSLFKYSKKYCELYLYDYYILSAKYGVLNKNELIMSYDLTLNNMNKRDIIIWSEKIKKNMHFLKENRLYILTGKLYYKYWIKEFENYKLVFEDLKGIGYILQFLKNKVEEYEK